MPLSMLQAAGADDRTMLIVLGVIALVTLVVLGLKFFRNIFEIITAPGASLKYHGQSDHFFYSLLIVFLGGLIATMIIVANQDKIAEAFSHYSTKVSTDLGAANSNPIYRDVATQYARTRIDDNFNIYFVQNMIMLPMLFVGIWLVLGFLVFVFSKLFQAPTTAADMLGTTAYSAFFMAIGVALASPLIIDFIASQAGGAAPVPGPLGIAGAVLILYGVVLFLMGIAGA